MFVLYHSIPLIFHKEHALIPRFRSLSFCFNSLSAPTFALEDSYIILSCYPCISHACIYLYPPKFPYPLPAPSPLAIFCPLPPPPPLPLSLNPGSATGVLLGLVQNCTCACDNCSWITPCTSQLSSGNREIIRMKLVHSQFRMQNTQMNVHLVEFTCCHAPAIKALN